MTTSKTNSVAAAAVTVKIAADTLTIDLTDGRTVAVPLGWYPRLAHGTVSERRNWRLIVARKPRPATYQTKAAGAGKGRQSDRSAQRARLTSKPRTGIGANAIVARRRHEVATTSSSEFLGGRSPSVRPAK